MKKSEMIEVLLDVVDRIDYTILQNTSEKFKCDYHTMIKDIASKFYDEFISMFQFRDRDLNVMNLSDVPEETINTIKNVVVNNVYDFQNDFLKVVGKVITKTFEKYIGSSLYINKTKLNALSKGELTKLFDEVQGILENVRTNPEMYLDRTHAENRFNYLVSKARKYGGCVVYPYNRSIFKGLVGDGFNHYISHESLDGNFDRTPEDYKRAIDAKRRETDSISAYYDRIGKCDF